VVVYRVHAAHDFEENPMKTDEKWEAWIRKTLKEARLEEPSPGALRRAVALGSQLPGKKALGQWLVELIFDSASAPLPAGVRGAAGGERRVLYQIGLPEGGEPWQLDLRVRRESGDTLAVTGQILPPLAGGRVEARVGRVRRTRELGESGEFLLRSLPVEAGTLRLEIFPDDGESLVIPDIPLLAKDEGPS
jgi:hypothetical protein